MAKSTAVLRRVVTATAKATSATNQLQKAENAIAQGQQMRAIARGKSRKRRLGKVVRRQAGARIKLGARLAAATDRYDSALLRLRQKNAVMQQEANARVARHQQTVQAAAKKLDAAEYAWALKQRQGRLATNVREAKTRLTHEQTNFAARVKQADGDLKIQMMDLRRKAANDARDLKIATAKWIRDRTLKRADLARQQRNLKRTLGEQQTVLAENTQNIKSNVQNRARNLQFQRQLNVAGARAQKIDRLYNQQQARLAMTAYPIQQQVKAWAGNAPLRSNMAAVGLAKLQNARPAANFKTSWPIGGTISRGFQVT